MCCIVVNLTVCSPADLSLCASLHLSRIHARMCLYVVVKADRTTTLASCLWQPPEGGGGAGEGVDEVSKDSCIAELYLLQSTIWTVSALQ